MTEGADRTDGRTDRRLFLIAGLPPIAVLGLAVGLFEVVGPLVAASAQGLLQGPLRGDAEIASGGLHWAISALLYAAASAALLAVCVDILRRRGRRWHLILAGLGCVASLLHLLIAAGNGHALSLIYFTSSNALAASTLLPAASLEWVRVALGVINLLSACLPSIALTAGLAAIASPSGAGLQAFEGALVARLRQVREVVTAASAFMVAGVLHMAAWTSWPLNLAAQEAAWHSVSGAVVFFWACTFTMMIAAFLLPAMATLRREAIDHLIDAGYEPAEQMAWLDEHGLSLRPSKQLPQVAAILSPLAAGSLNQLFGAVGDIG